MTVYVVIGMEGEITGVYSTLAAIQERLGSKRLRVREVVPGRWAIGPHVIERWEVER